MFPGSLARVMVPPRGVVSICAPRPICNFLLPAPNTRIAASLPHHPLLREGFACTGILFSTEANTQIPRT